MFLEPSKKFYLLTTIASHRSVNCSKFGLCLLNHKQKRAKTRTLEHTIANIFFGFRIYPIHFAELLSNNNNNNNNNTIYFKLATMIAATLIKANYIKK